MIPEIGVMVGLYIVTRMGEMMVPKTSVAVRISAVVTTMVAMLVMVDLFTRGATIPKF